MEISTINKKLGAVRVGVIGDFALDAYWHADMTRSTISRETPRFPLPVYKEIYAPGAAGNVAVNAAALGAKVTALGILGRDWRADVLRGCLRKNKVDESGLIGGESCVTSAYIKPMLHGISEVVYEDARIDFVNAAPPQINLQQALLSALEQVWQELDVLCVCDQMENGCITPLVRQKLSQLAKRGLPVLADSRENIGSFTGVLAKPNELEACRAFPGLTPQQAGLALSKQNGCACVVTLGEKGCLLCENGSTVQVPAFAVAPPVDICGAGDAFLAALAVYTAVGAELCGAVRAACAASAVVIQKIGETGSASPAEIAALLDRHR